MNLRDQLQNTLGTSYTIDRELGGGGMSHVFVAMDERLRRQVVIKVLSPELSAGVSAERFEREIQLVASLQQANIVPLLSAGETNGVPFYTMPLVDGESLRSRLSKHGALPIAQCVSILRDVARALSYAHAHGVVHRDIKPDNVLLSHGAAMVSDFGIAKAISVARTQPGGAALTQAGMSVGTPAYMAPEQVAGDADIDHRADLYALGCVAYELLAGRTPFVETSPQKMLAAHLTQTPQDVRQRRSDAAPVLAAMVMQCLEKSPAARPASADDVLRSLDAVVTPSGSQGSALPRMGGLIGNWRRAAVLVVAATALAVGGAVWARTSRRAGADTKSIAVLPLANLSGDPANDYFGEGLADEMTGALAKAGLRVVCRSGARVLVAKGLDAQAIAQQLGVAAILQGNVQRAADRIRITVTLVSGSDRSVLWTGKYDRQIADVFAVQDEIAHSVANELHATLTGRPAHLVTTETSDPEAHALYLQGLYLWNRRNGPAIRQAIGLFKLAVQRDPNYARAYGGMAMAYLVLPTYADVKTDSVLVFEHDAAQHARRLDSTLVEAWAADAFADAQRWKNALAEREFVSAIALDSSFAPAHYWYGFLLNQLGRFDDARRELARARELEPTSMVYLSGSTLPDVAQHRFATAEAMVKRTMLLDSSYVVAHFVLAGVLIDAGRYDEGIHEASSVPVAVGVRPVDVRATLAYAYAAGGRAADARRVIAEIHRVYGTLPPSATLACALLRLGDRAAALAMFRQAVNDHDPWLHIYNRSPRFDGFRADPEGAKLLETVEHP